MKRRTIIKPKKQEGMLLVGTMLGLFIIGAVVTGGIYYYNNKRIEDRGKLAGEQIRILGQAVDEYISINRDKIAKLQSDSHLKCQNNGFCEITVAGLRDNGELPNTFSDKNAWGSEYKIQIKRVGQAPDYQITGIVVTTQAPNKPKMLGFALQTGGANAGNNLIDLTKISGTSGLWSYTNQDYSIISNQQYQLAYRVGYNASQYSPYLRRDGSLNMTGDLQMAGHSIKNIDFLNANNESIQNSLNVGGKTNTNALQVNGNAEIAGQLSGNLIPRQTAVAGQNCSPNGLVAKDETGALLSCVSGSWEEQSSSSNIFIIKAPDNTDIRYRNSAFLYKRLLETSTQSGGTLQNYTIHHQSYSTFLQIINKNITCLYNDCKCKSNEIGIIINNNADIFTIACKKYEKINFQTYINICQKEKHQNKNNCINSLNKIISQRKGILGFTNHAYRWSEQVHTGTNGR